MSRDPDETVRFTFEHPIAFTTLDADQVEVQATELVVDTEVVDPEVELVGTVPLAAWELLFATGAFHLDDEPAPAGFEPQLPVLLRLQLRPAFARRYASPEELLRELLGEEDGPLRGTEAWYALEATQRLAVPGQAEGWVDIGIRTSFADG